MQCSEFEDRLNDVLDRRGDPAGDLRLAAHVRQCESCRDLWAGQWAMLAGLRQPAPALGKEFSRRVVAVAVSAPLVMPRRIPRFWLAAATVAASAAAALLAVSLLWLARKGLPGTAGQPRDSAPVVDSALAQPQKLVQSQKLVQQKLVDRRPGSRRGGYAGGLALVQMTRLPQHYRGAVENLPETLPDAVQRLDDVDRLAPGIRPIRLSFAMLWDALCRALPGGRATDEPQGRPDTSHFGPGLPALA